jgi:cystathionine gamma-lyase / homocysteine desulfhydrase
MSNHLSPDAGPSTLCVHAGTYHHEQTGGVNSPIFTSTAYAFPNPANENVYPRYFNVPNQRVVAAKVAGLEGAQDGLVFGSGMAAISTVLMTFLRPGDHALFQADLYGGTHHFVGAGLAAWGVQTSFARNAAEFRAGLRPNTKVFYLESPSNPLLRCVDLRAVAQLAREHGVLSVIDNTFATPINQKPLELGFELVIHSATKYLNGHSDLNAGVVVSSRAVIQRLYEPAMNHGGMLDPQACYQLERGLKTLALRVKQQNQNAGLMVEFLKEHPAVSRVHYPGLAEHPDHALAAAQMRGFGGMLAFEMRAPAKAEGMLRRLRLAAPALSLGGVETLVCLPSHTSHRTMSAEERREAGIGEGLVRVSVGIEDSADLLGDFDQALSG